MPSQAAVTFTLKRDVRTSLERGETGGEQGNDDRAHPDVTRPSPRVACKYFGLVSTESLTVNMQKCRKYHRLVRQLQGVPTLLSTDPTLADTCCSDSLPAGTLFQVPICAAGLCCNGRTAHAAHLGRCRWESLTAASRTVPALLAL